MLDLTIWERSTKLLGDVKTKGRRMVVMPVSHSQGDDARKQEKGPGLVGRSAQEFSVYGNYSKARNLNSLMWEWWGMGVSR